MKTFLRVTKGIFYTLMAEPSPALAKQRDRCYFTAGAPV